MYTDIGAFRTVCEFSHMAFDDPIVYPGQPGRSHLHAFFGNTGIDAQLDRRVRSPAAATRRAVEARSTAPAYWAPAIIDTRDGTPVKPDSLISYYKTGYRGIAPAAVQPMPTGLRMIAGDSKASAPTAGGIAIFNCFDPSYRPGPQDGGTPNHLPCRQHDLGHRDVSAMLGRRPSGFAGPQEPYGLPGRRRMPHEPSGAVSRK